MEPLSIGFPIEIPLRGIELYLRKRKQLNIRRIVRNCKELRTPELLATELRATELLFHLKINNLNCDLQVYAADTRMKISL